MVAWPPLLIRIAMTASTPARILTVALLLLSIAPWASLYALMVSLNVNGAFLSPQTGDDQMSLASVLQDPNATLDELYRALFRESLTKAMNPNNIHHWTIVLPWGISLTLGVVIPFLLSLCACIRQDPWISRIYREEKRLARLTLESKHYRTTLAEDDKENDERWIVNGNSFEGMCAICLTQYATGDQIIFSSNPKCQHVFHGDCILSWLVKRRQCPCCRQVFFPKKE